MHTIITNNDAEKQFKSTIDTFFKKNKINFLLKQSNFSKEKGFRMLTLGWSDGNTFLPLAFTLLSSEKEFQGRSYESMVAHTSIVFTRLLCYLHKAVIMKIYVQVVAYFLITLFY